MNILFIGDIIGRPGRNAVKKILPELKHKYAIDLVIANGENLASGIGMTEKTYNEMIDAGIDYFTSGNHIFNKKEFLPILDDKETKVLRPVNYSGNVQGKGWVDLDILGGRSRLQHKIRLINLQGNVFMKDQIDNPFLKADKLLDDMRYAISDKPDVIIVDFHAEATSEKNSFAYYLDGRVKCIVGTHTHIQTNDARILPKGTAYMTDVGMVGPINSSIGDDLKHSIHSFLTGEKFKIEPAKGPCIFNSALIKINPNNKVETIETINKNID